MDHTIEHARFQRQQLTVRTHPLLAPKLFLDGAEVKRNWTKFEVTDDSGTPTTIKLRSGLDLQPRVVIDGGEPFAIAPSLPSYAYVFIYAPLLLMLIGGAIGGLFGALAAVGSAAAFRSELPTAAKIGASILMTGAAFVAYIVAAGMLHVVLGLL